MEAGNFTLHYAKTGRDTAPTLFFIHGSPGSWNKFERYLKDPELIGTFRMISIDRPGFGYSEYGQAKNLSEQSNLISALLRKIDNKKPIYALGRSYGGPLGVKLAADNPGFFSGLFLFAAAVDPKAERPERWRKWLTYPPFKFFVPGAWKQSNAELWELKKDLIDLSTVFPTISCPVYIFHSADDKLVPVRNVHYAKQMLVNVKQIEETVLPGKAHNISDSAFERIKQTLLKLPR